VIAIPLRVYVYAGAALALALGTWWAYDWAYDRGAESRQQQIDGLRETGRVQTDVIKGLRLTLKAQTDELAKRDEQDKKIAKAAEEAVKAAEAAEHDANQALDYALKQLQEASRKPACKAVLDMDLTACAL
jgi:ribosome-binding ATPase YchF (GTP1/OBG family)